MSKKRVTSFDVAKKAGVSRSVVSAVLNNTPGIGVSEETRETVLAAISELNYHVDAQARSMRTGKSLCLAAHGDTRQPLFVQLLEGMQRECEARGYHILISSPGIAGPGREGLLTLFHQRKIDGIITLDETSYCDKQWAERVMEAAIPYVSVEGYAEYDGVSSIQADYRGSVELALDYMFRPEIDAGRLPLSRIAPLYVEMYSGRSRENWAERNRREAYIKWCEKMQAEPRFCHLHLEQLEQLEKLLKEQLAAEQRLSGLFINWSSSVPDLYRAAWRLGLRVGEELRVMAADNTIRGHRLIVPSLSCVEIPYVKMGEEAVRCVLRQLEASPRGVQPEKIWLPAILRAGDSA